MRRNDKAGPAAARRPTSGSAARRAPALALLLALLGAAAPAAAQTLEGAALVAALRDGGFNLYFRHAETDWSRPDQVRSEADLPSCDPGRMRQLSEEGRATARAVGAAMRRLAIPVVRVLASPYCRTIQTARDMDLGPEVTPTDDVMNLRAAEYFGGRQAIVETARRLLATPPPAGGNVVIVAHGNVAREATPVYPGEGEGVVFRPLPDGEFEVVARIDRAAWEALAQAHGRSPE